MDLIRLLHVAVMIVIFLVCIYLLHKWSLVLVNS